MISPEELAALKAEHTPKEVPPCPVCGGERAVIAWEAPLAYIGCKAAVGKDDEHYSTSRYYVRKTDPRVLRLIEAYERVVANIDRVANRLPEKD